MTTVVKGKLLEQDIAKWDGITRTATRKDQTGGTIAGNSVGHEVDVLEVYGAGSSYTWQTITDCINRIGSSSVTLLFKPGTWTVDQNLTIGSNFTCRVPAGCVFNVSSGKTLTFSGPVIRDAQTWTSGSGTVTENGTRYVSGKLDLTGAVIQGTSALVFEGSSDDAFETTFSITSPTADRTITFPDADVNLGSIAGTSGNNTWTGNNTFTSDVTVQSSDAGAAVGPTLILDRNSASAADSDVLGGIIFRGRDDAGGTDDYGQIQAEAVDTGAASEDGKISIQTKVAGTLATRAYVAQGFVVGSPTGTDKGGGAINCVTLYINGSQTYPGFEYIKTSTLSAGSTVAFVDDTDFDFSLYDEVLFQFTSATMVNNNNYVTVALGTGAGPTYDTTSGYVGYIKSMSSGATERIAASTTTSFQLIDNAAGYSLANNANNVWYGHVRMIRPTATTGYRAIDWKFDFMENGGAHITAVGAGHYTSNTGTALSGIRFGNGGGNWSCTVRAYGLRNS